VFELIQSSSFFSNIFFFLKFVGFIFQAVLIFSKESSLFHNLSHHSKVQLHWIFNGCGIMCILVGGGIIYYHKEFKSRPHLTTWHGLIGFITIIYALIQFIGGHNLTILNNIASKFIPYRTRCMYHATSGTFMFVLACVSLSLGIFSNWFSEATPFYIWYLAFALTSFLGLIVANQVTNKYVKPKQYQSFQPKTKAKDNKKKE
jgi:cytochrome b-561 domain containing protein 2